MKKALILCLAICFITITFCFSVNAADQVQLFKQYTNAWAVTFPGDFTGGENDPQHFVRSQDGSLTLTIGPEAPAGNYYLSQRGNVPYTPDTANMADIDLAVYKYFVIKYKNNIPAGYCFTMEIGGNGMTKYQANVGEGVFDKTGNWAYLVVDLTSNIKEQTAKMTSFELHFFVASAGGQGTCTVDSMLFVKTMNDVNAIKNGTFSLGTLLTPETTAPTTTTAPATSPVTADMGILLAALLTPASVIVPAVIRRRKTSD